MFSKILIANRGEIACRIAATAGNLGIRTVAVYSEADRDALHVRRCDEARLIGPPPAADSYLRRERIIEAALACGAEAIHPGYGFLSENADFANACHAHGITFIGPGAAAIRAMGSKSEAKNIMAAAGVPVLGGYQGEDQSADVLLRASDEAGYPVLLKAVAGGGGKGMRIVNSRDQFEAALEAVKREASASFADDRVLVEQYLPVARHVEVQVFADGHGNALHLFERDCSVQRRHQKVIEEAPAPGLDQALRHDLGKAAVEAARAIGYVGAGTVEFLLDPDHRFYFMEMNTRLQVEHPVTEMITGQDLVEWQLRVAAGEPVPCGQDDLAINGHAMEARIYAENPDTDFLPSTGTLSVLDPGRDRPWKRIDSGVCQGDTIHPYYDPMIAKLITWGEDRETARRRLERALAEFDIAGVTTNTGFLLKLIRLADFSAARLHTGIIPQNHDTLFDVTGSDAVEQEALAMATLYLAGHYGQGAEVGDPATPWVGGPWRLNLPGRVLGRFTCGDREQEYTLYWSQGRWSGEIDGETRPLRLQPLGAARYHFLAGDSQQQASIYRVDNTLHLNLGGEQRQLTVVDPGRSDAELVTPSGSLNAPMPGSVIALNVSPGDSVNAGDALMVLEAMKMEHTISAPHDGVVQRLLFQPGDQVKEGDLLLELTDPESGDDA